MHQAFQHSSQISEIEKYFLECRKQEKNFIISHDAQSVQLFASNSDPLNVLISTMSIGVSNEQMIEKLTDLSSKI